MQGSTTKSMVFQGPDRLRKTMLFFLTTDNISDMINDKINIIINIGGNHG